MKSPILETARTIEPRDLDRLLKKGERYQLIDVRSSREFDEGHLPGAVNIPLEQVESRLQDLHADDHTVLVCQSGRRAEICRGLLERHRDGLTVLEGGTQAWIETGLPVVRTTANRLPLMRQVHLVAGLLGLTGALLGRFVAPDWTFLAAFVGAGLAIAGATGFCGMANLLSLMPWNKTAKGTDCPR